MPLPGTASPRQRPLAALLVALVLGACAAGDARPLARDAASPQPGRADVASPVPTVAPSGPFPAGHVTLLPSAGEPVRVAVHVAADPQTRQRGLMHREEVPPGTGMLFTWPGDSSGAFWMKDTLVPLSIAFADEGGRILRILDMEPCETDPCPRYDPGLAYRFALEVPRGDFERLGVREGDTLVVPEGLGA